MLIQSKSKLNAYINKINNQRFYTSMPFSGDVTLNINTMGTTLPCNNFYIETDPLSPTALFYKFEYIVDGKGYLECNNTKYELTEGTLIFIRKNIGWTMYSDSDTPMKKHFINVSGRFIDGILSAHKIVSPVIVIKTDVLTEFENILQYFEESDQMSYELLNAVESELLRMVQKLDLAVMNKELTHITRAENILSYIEQNLTTKLSIEDIASAFFISESQLIRIFKKKYNTTPMQYIIARKIYLAEYYLKRTEMSVSEISSLLCFTDRKYFSKVFKKHVGESPLIYKKSSAKKKRNMRGVKFSKEES